MITSRRSTPSGRIARDKASRTGVQRIGELAPCLPDNGVMKLVAFAAGLLLLAPSLMAQTAPTGAWAEVNGHRLYYERSGSGRPLVLLHGGGNSIQGSFSKQLGEFSKSRAIVAPEQVGQGHTPDVAAPLTYAGMAEDTAALLRQLKLTDVDLVGWSDGGNVALILALRHPELVRSVVVSGANFAPEGLPADDLRAMREKEAHPDPAKPFEAKLNHLWLTSPTPSELSPALLARIHKPVLVLSGDHDAIRLDHTVELYRALPQARLCVLPATGHATFNERPEWVNAIVLAFFEEK
jgi:pimeloyl-ACP methyl ester carboxylesterase